MGGTHVEADAGAHAQPPALLRTGLRLERMALGAFDGCLREHRVTEESASTRTNAGKPFAAVDHYRETRVVTQTPRDQPDVAAASLIESDSVRMHLADPGNRLLDHCRVLHLRITAGYTRQAQVHLHQCVRRARAGRGDRGVSRGTAAAHDTERERAPRNHQKRSRSSRTGRQPARTQTGIRVVACRTGSAGRTATCRFVSPSSR